MFLTPFIMLLYLVVMFLNLPDIFLIQPVTSLYLSCFSVYLSTTGPAYFPARHISHSICSQSSHPVNHSTLHILFPFVIFLTLPFIFEHLHDTILTRYILHIPLFSFSYCNSTFFPIRLSPLPPTPPLQLVSFPCQLRHCPVGSQLVTRLLLGNTYLTRVKIIG